MMVRVVLALLLMTEFSMAGSVAILGGGQITTSPTCTTEVYSDTSGGSGVNKVGGGTYYGYAGEFTNSTNDCICKVVLPILKVGSPSGTLTVKLYSKGGDNHPDSLLGTANGGGGEANNGTVTGSDLSTIYQDFTFTFSTCVTLSGANNYVYLVSDTLNSASVYFSGQYNATGTLKTESFASAWAAVDNSSYWQVRIYK